MIDESTVDVLSRIEQAQLRGELPAWVVRDLLPVKRLLDQHQRAEEALGKIERLKDRWSAPLTHPVGDMRDPAYAGAAAWAAVGSEAHKIAVDYLRYAGDMNLSTSTTD